MGKNTEDVISLYQEKMMHHGIQVISITKNIHAPTVTVLL
jgi:hypothetical protein